MTGCDSSKDNDTKNPQFVKHGKDDTFTFNDGTKVVFYGVKSSADGKAPYHAITFTFTAPVNSATATLSPLNFSAYVTAPMTCTGLNRTAELPKTPLTPILIAQPPTVLPFLPINPSTFSPGSTMWKERPLSRSHTTVRASSSRKMQTATKLRSLICLPVSTLLFSDFRNCSLPAV